MHKYKLKILDIFFCSCEPLVQSLLICKICDALFVFEMRIITSKLNRLARAKLNNQSSVIAHIVAIKLLRNKIAIRVMAAHAK